MCIAKQNFWFATATNLGGALAGALGLLSPVTAGLLHIAHILGVLANSSRLLSPTGTLPAAEEKFSKGDIRKLSSCTADAKDYLMLAE